MVELEHPDAGVSTSSPKFERWVITEGISQVRKNFGVVAFAALLHFLISTVSDLLQLEGATLQQLMSGSRIRYVLLEMLLSVIGIFAVVPVLMATHVSLLKGVSNWRAIASRPFKEWDRFVGGIVFWAMCGALIMLLPAVFLPDQAFLGVTDRSVLNDELNENQKFGFLMSLSALSATAFAVFSILIATWMPAIINEGSTSLRRVIVRGKTTFWYVLSRLIIFILFTLAVSASVLAILTPILQAVLPMLENPTLLVFIVNAVGTAIITSCLVPVFSVICVRAYILGEARLNASSSVDVEAEIPAETKS
ncbi:hypothetical protein [Thalassospira lucentensis]|uniref:hypothetical protein n=1 Tax=Thalassospira lucentensis TaxID=168935 RepID=UPI003AA96454